jgi:hypothetical protein
VQKDFCNKICQKQTLVPCSAANILVPYFIRAEVGRRSKSHLVGRNFQEFANSEETRQSRTSTKLNSSLVPYGRHRQAEFRLRLCISGKPRNGGSIRMLVCHKTGFTDGGIAEAGSPRPVVLIGAVLALAVAVGIGLAWSHSLLAALTLDEAPRIAAVVIFIATYFVIAIGKLPRFQLDRTGQRSSARP